MKKIILTLALTCFTLPTAHACDWLWSVFSKPCNGVVKAYETGDDELLLSGYAYHLRSSYTPEKIREFNEKAWGIGYGKTAEEANGDTHMLFWLVFRESHFKNQVHLGYAYNTYWGPRTGLQASLGYTAMLVQRPDIASGIPFPAILPTAGVKWNNTSLNFIFIPKISKQRKRRLCIFASQL
jgi:Antimicrobial peptide resistance and lipid A acylation protein PagP